MTLDWTFSFIQSSLDKNPIIDHVCSFRNGAPQFTADPDHYPEVIHQMESLITLINYIAFFPNKDFTKIKLKTSGNQFAIHFLDKRYLKEGFLGILSVSEVNQEKVYESWGVEDIMAEFVFENYRDLQKRQNMEGGFRFQDFEEWLRPEIKDFYIDWQDAREKEEFSHGHTHNPLGVSSDRGFEQWWDLQIINEFGQPLTDLISYIDDQAFTLDSESDKMDQNLESMSISALKILIDTQGGWNINYLKNRLKNQMGFQYIFFEKFTVGDIKYLIIMNSAIYDIETGTCLQAFRGFEFELLDRIASRVSHHTLFFTDQGQLKPENKNLTQRIILNCVDQFYSN